MRDYLFLSQLDSAGYNIGVADTLHLGAGFKLPVYIYLEGSAYFTDGVGGEVFRENDLYLRLAPCELKRIEKTYIDSTIRSPAQTDHLKELFSISTGIVDGRYRGPRDIKIMPHLLALMENCGGSVLVHDKDGIPISGRIGELMCYTADLKKLTKGAEEQSEEVKTSDVDTERQDCSPANETEIKRIQRTVAALALGLAAKSGTYNKAGKPNVSQLAKLATEHLRDEKNDRTPHGFGPSTVRSVITDALKACPELKK